MPELSIVSPVISRRVLTDAVILAATWSFIIGISLVFIITNEKGQTIDLARNSAREHFAKDQAFRLWASSHGGAYVPIDERTPPNKHLSHIPERDITTPSGKRLTLMNPAYMLGQLMSEYADMYGIKGRIVSIKPLNPKNAPDDWERRALESFDNEAKEAVEFTEIDNKPYLRLMKPMLTKESCLKCHGFQGYKVGDIRGGVGVSIPLTPYLVSEQSHVNHMAFSHFIMWLFGMASIVFVSARRKRNLTDRERAERKLVRSNTLLNAIIDQAPFGILIAEGRPERWRITRANREAERINGATEDEHSGFRFIDGKFENSEKITWEMTRPDGSPLTPERTPLPMAMNGDEQNNVELIVKNSDGEKTVILCNAGPIHDESGNIIAGIVTYPDITEHKKAEEALRESETRFRSIFAHAPIGMSITALDGTIIAANSAALEMLGYTESDLENLNSKALYKNIDDRKSLMEKMATEEVVKGFNVVLMRKSGEDVDCRVTVSRFDLEGQKVLISTLEDISEKKAVAKARQQLLRAQNYFTSVTAHELRTPISHLQLVKMLLDSVADDMASTPEIVKSRGILESTCHNIEKVVQATTILSDLQLRDTSEKIRPVNLKDVVMICVDISRTHAKGRKRSLSVEVDIDSFGERVIVACDQTLVEKALVEALSNAVKYSPDGATVRVTGTVDSGMAILKICDEGIGLSPEELETVSHPFYSPQNPDQHHTGRYEFMGGGIGLGVSIIRLIVEYHGGKFDISSPGKNMGVTVSMSFPLASNKED